MPKLSSPGPCFWLESASESDKLPLKSAVPFSVNCPGVTTVSLRDQHACMQHRGGCKRPSHPTWQQHPTSNVHCDWPPKSESAAVRNFWSNSSAPLSSLNENHTRSLSTDMSQEKAFFAMGISFETHPPAELDACRLSDWMLRRWPLPLWRIPEVTALCRWWGATVAPNRLQSAVTLVSMIEGVSRPLPVCQPVPRMNARFMRRRSHTPLNITAFFSTIEHSMRPEHAGIL
jgi:hypothetical protein